MAQSDDLLTLLEAQAVLGLGTLTAHQGTLLPIYITGCSRALVERVGTIVYGTVTGELHDGTASNGRRRHCIYLNNSPVQGVVQVVEYDETTAATLTAETNATKAATNYLIETTAGKLRRRDSNGDAWFPAGRSNVFVTYVAGRYGATSSVGERFKQAAALTLKNAWRTHEAAAVTVGEFDVPQASFPTFTIPRAVKDLLADEWRQGSGTGD